MNTLPHPVVERLQRIREALGNQEIDVASRRAHSLKGTGGMIGATTLAAQAADLDQAIKNRSPDMAEHLKRFEQELDRVLDGIKAAYKLG